MGKLVNRLSMVVLGVLIVLRLIFTADLNVVQAAEFELTYSGNWPPTHPVSMATQEWIKKIEKEAGGRVKIRAFWASALYKPRESALELAKGVADIGDISGAYAPMGYDFEKSMRMAFWGLRDRKLARKVYYAAMEKYLSSNGNLLMVVSRLWPMLPCLLIRCCLLKKGSTALVISRACR